mmetsp:Transcript_41238/g.47508  ORF Transcript_41238/g.47508 Transcript_41238/m.47508 type:complete len:133 (+) Transcript_41238:1982-2380(+)
MVLKVPEADEEGHENVEVAATFDSHTDFGATFEAMSKFLVKYTNCFYFGGVVGASAINFKKMSLVSKLFSICKATNKQGELILEKAFIESRHDSELKARLNRGIDYIIAWLFLSSGEHAGPVQKYINSIEDH